MFMVWCVWCGGVYGVVEFMEWWYLWCGVGTVVVFMVWWCLWCVGVYGGGVYDVLVFMA